MGCWCCYYQLLSCFVQAFAKEGRPACLHASTAWSTTALPVSCTPRMRARCTGDPSLLFRDLVTRPAHPDAATITSTQLALYYRQMVQQLGMQLHLLGGPHEVLCRPLEQIQLLLDQYLHLVASLALAGRDDVIEGFVGYNLQTMEPLDLATCDHKAAAAAVVASLGLLAQQEDMIAHSLGVGAPMLQVCCAGLIRVQRAGLAPHHHLSTPH